MVSTPFINLPREILPEIMTYWGGHRLGLTCRALNARMTDEYLGKFAQEISVDFKETYSTGDQPEEYTATHHELPDGTFHGPAHIDCVCDLNYSRGRLVDGTSIGYNGNVNVRYHGNWIVQENITDIIDEWSIQIDCKPHWIRVDWSRLTIDGIIRSSKYIMPDNIPLFHDRVASRKWLDIVISAASVHLGSEFSADIGRGKLEVMTGEDVISTWPDVEYLPID